MSRGITRSSFLHVLEVHQLEAAAIFFQQLHRILSGIDDPKDVHLKANEFWFCLGHQQVKQGAVAVGKKLVTMSVIEKLQTMFGKRFPGSIEYGRCFATGFFVEWIFMRNPRTAYIL